MKSTMKRSAAGRLLALALILLFAVQAASAADLDLKSLSDGELLDLWQDVNGEIYTRFTAKTDTDEETGNESANELLRGFFTFWSGDDLDGMLSMCAPSWYEAQEEPRLRLFTILQNRTPLSYTPMEISDVEGGRIAEFDRHNGREPQAYRLAVVMMKENGQWFIDPECLWNYEVYTATEAPDETGSEPTPAPEITADTVLYYNPEGGTMYHLDPECRIIHPNFLPLTGHFTVSQLNDPEYSELRPCNVCGAPER